MRKIYATFTTGWVNTMATRLVVTDVKPTLFEARQLLGLTQRKLAVLAGVTQQTISKAELCLYHRSSISIESAELIANAVGLTVDDINWQKPFGASLKPPGTRHRNPSVVRLPTSCEE